MHRVTSFGLALAALLVIGSAGPCPVASAQSLKVVSDQTVTGFKFPESVAYDPQAKVLYVSQFGSEMKPAEKDGKGRIARVSLDGKILDDQFLPTGSDVLHKPKGVWVEGNRLWVTDIDAVWIFDLMTRRGRKLDLPGITFANDLAVKGGALFVSDNRGDSLARVEPADFLDAASPKVTTVFSGKSINPNGLYPSKDGSLLMVGFKAVDQPRGIYAMRDNGEITTLAVNVGALDGLYQMDDGSLLVTNWSAGALVRWSAATGIQPVASGFKGPADFCVVPEAGGLLVVVPDLPKSELRLLRLGR